MQLQEANIDCPYCWESITVLLDTQELGAEYTEDCQVCCRPMIVQVTDNGAGELAATVRREDD